MQLNNSASLRAACHVEINPKEKKKRQNALMVKTDDCLSADLISCHVSLQILSNVYIFV